MSKKLKGESLTIKPQATIFAGVNGAGKTTLYYNELELGNDFGFRINIDEIVSSFGNPKNQQDQIRASKIAIKIREKCIQESKDFNQESTLCGASILALFPKLKNKNYQINLYYIGVDSPKLAKQRVKMRVAKGGHDVKDELIEKRYFQSLKNLEKICHLCDKIVVFDNSKEFQKILEFENKKLNLYRETTWIENIFDKIRTI